MSQFCPESELIAAYVEGRLTADEVWRLENHFAVCDDCRREAALLHLHSAAPAESTPMSRALKQRARAAISRAMDRERSAGTRRQRTIRDRRSGPGWVAAAAVLALAIGALLLWVNQRSTSDSNRTADERPAKKSEPSVPKNEPARNEAEVPDGKSQTPKKTEREESPQIPEKQPERETGEKPKEDPKKHDEKKQEETKVVEKPKEEPPKQEETKPTEAIARSYDSFMLTDLRGELSIKRGGHGKPEKVTSLTSVAKGDVLTADKPSSFNIEGKYGVVLPKDSEVMVAQVPKEESTWLSVQKGEALVDSGGGGGRRWILSDGKNVVMVDRTRGKFGASRQEDGLSILALSEDLSCTPEGGSPRTLRSGDEMLARGKDAQVRRSDAAEARRAMLADHKSGERTIFYATCDRADLKSGRYEIKEGLLDKERIGKTDNEFLVGVERQRALHATLQINQRVNWTEEFVVRFRYRTNGRTLRVELPLPGDKGIFIAEVETNKANVGAWVQFETPLNRFGIAAGKTVTLTRKDRLESIHISTSEDQTHGGKAYLGVDDVQFVDR